MKGVLTTLVIVFLFSFFANGQIKYNYPSVNYQTEKDIVIKKVTISDYSTKVDFIYTNTKSQGHYIILYGAGRQDAMYIKANGIVYKLTSTYGISDKNGETVAYPNKPVEFSAYFEKIPITTTTFDLIEGTDGDWNFYGVKLGSANSSSNYNSNASQQFKRDYNYISIYDNATQKWGDWQEGINTFVFNINDNGDFKLYKANGEIETFRRISDVKEDYTTTGERYQIIGVLDESGNECLLQLFDFGDAKLIINGGMIQFTNGSN